MSRVVVGNSRRCGAAAGLTSRHVHVGAVGQCARCMKPSTAPPDSLLDAWRCSSLTPALDVRASGTDGCDGTLVPRDGETCGACVGHHGERERRAKTATCDACTTFPLCGRWLLRGLRRSIVLHVRRVPSRCARTCDLCAPAPVPRCVPRGHHVDASRRTPCRRTRCTARLGYVASCWCHAPVQRPQLRAAPCVRGGSVAGEATGGGDQVVCRAPP